MSNTILLKIIKSLLLVTDTLLPERKPKRKTPVTLTNEKGKESKCKKETRF